MSEMPIRISTLRSGVKLGFDLYVKLPHKLLLYAKGDDDIEQLRIQYLKNKKVRKLFIKEVDETLYQEYIDRCLQETMSDESLDINEKAEVVVEASEGNAQRIFEDPKSQKSYTTAQNTSQNLISVLGQSEEILKAILDRTTSSDNDSLDEKMHKHAVNTASICISFAEFLGLDNELVQHLGVGGLFHDIAYSEMESKELFFKSEQDMSVDEKKQYELHPKLGAEMLQDKDFADDVIINLILSHEEKRGGNGFPNKLSTLDTGQEIISIAAFYDRQLTCFGKTREEVFEDFSINQLGNYDLDMIKKFKSFIKKSGL